MPHPHLQVTRFAQYHIVGVDALLLYQHPHGQPFTWFFLDDADNVQLVEKPASGGWGTAQVLSTDEVRGASGLSLDYHTAGHTCVAVERLGGSPGLYIGIRPAGESFAWEQVTDDVGLSAESIKSLYHLDSPVVVFYAKRFPPNDGTVVVAEKLAGNWEPYALPFNIHGEPLGLACDASGNLILGGLNLTTNPNRAVVAVLYE